MRKHDLLGIMICVFGALGLSAQNTVGLLSYNPSDAYDGYNLIYPHNQPNVYLLDNCGEIVHTWEDDASFRPGNTAYLMENGNLVKTKRPANISQDPIWAGGGGAIVEIRSWENDLLWSFTMNDSLQRLHHDIEVLKNGNIIMIAWEKKTREEAIQAGRDTNLITEGEIWPDFILEVNPNTDEIVWEWHAWDHLIQDFDPTKDNFGVVADHPELIDLNWDTNDGEADWLHSNSIDVHPFDGTGMGFDLVMISVPQFHEFWVIDHSTTTEEAASSAGGDSNRGGNLMYRWGNPQTYDRGDSTDQKLFYQHDVHWSYDFLEPSHPEYLQIALFNNRVGNGYSTVNTLRDIYEMYDFEFPLTGETWGPEDFRKTVLHPDTFLINSSGLSSVQCLPNNNVLVCNGRTGYSVELTPENDIAWEYRTPLRAGAAVEQGTILELNNNLTFRMTRYPSDFAAFDGKELAPQGFIELNPDSTFCDMIISNVENTMKYQINAFPNPATQTLTIEWEAGIIATIEVFSALGQKVEQFVGMGGRKFIDVSDWDQGVYYLMVDGSALKKLLIIHP